jgi:phosphatidylserine decarboxylase
MSIGEQAEQPVNIPLEQIDSSGFSIVTLLPPDNELRRTTEGSLMHLSGRLMGAEVHFQALLVDASAGGRDGMLRAQLPHHCEHLERRQAPRFPVPADGDTLAVVHTRAEVFLCQLRDLSFLGVGLRLKAAEARLPKGERRLLCEIRRGDLLLQSKIEIHWTHVEDRHECFGGSFIDVSPSAQDRIDRLVTELERNWLRSRLDR